jgi:hypothetical protein
VVALIAARHRDCPLTTCQRLFKGDVHLDVQIGATLWRRLPGAALGEHFREQIAEGRRVVDASRREVEPFESTPRRGIVCVRRMSRVVAGAAGRIDQRLVGLEDLTESRRGCLITRIDIRVKPTRKTTVSPLDLGLTRALLYA